MTPTQQNIVEDLDCVKTILEDLVIVAEEKCKGYAAGAIDLAADAVAHAIDLVRVAEMMK